MASRWRKNEPNRNYFFIIRLYDVLRRQVTSTLCKGDNMSETKIVFWDVEHGHAAYLKAPNGRHIVIDLGTGSYGSGDEFSPLDHLKYQYGIKQLDYVIIIIHMLIT